MTITPPDGLTRALQLAAEGSTALEYTHAPTVADKKKARDLYKRATKIMDSIVGLEEEGIYSTGPIPADPDEARYNDPAQHRIELPEILPEAVSAPAPVEVPDALPPMPDLLGQFAELGPDSQDAIFEDCLPALWGSVEHGPVDEDPLSEWAKPWEAAYAESRLDTYARMVYALEHRKPASYAFPDDEEMSTWRAQFAQPLPPLPEELAMFDVWEDEDAAREFDRRLDLLAEACGELTEYDPWDQAWDADAKDAFTRLLVAEAREPKTFEVPTEEERDAWLAQFAPVTPIEEDAQAGDPAEAVDPSVLFEQKLDELQEAGVSESGLKRKAWPKAAKAWRAAFAEDPTGTLDKLLWSLTKADITWNIPTDEEIAA